MKDRTNTKSRWARHVNIGASLLIALGLGLSACGDDNAGGGGDNNGGGSIGTNESAELTITPQAVVFDQVDIGSPSRKLVTLENTGSGNLTVKSIELKEDQANGDGTPEFAKGADGWSEDSFTIEPGGIHSLTVTYTPQDQALDSGAIVLETNVPDHGGTFRVPLDTQDLAPEIYAAPSVNFQRVPPRPNDPDWEGDFQFLAVQNTGVAPLEIDRIHVEGSDRFHVTFPESAEAPPADDADQGPSTVAPNESFQVRVWFKPDDDQPESGELIFDTNDPINPEYSVALSGNSGAPCMSVTPGEEIAFGQGSLGRVSQKTVTIENCSRSEALEVSGITVTDDGGGVYALEESSLPGGLPDDVATIDPAERANFVVTFEPDREEAYEGELVIESNDGANDELHLPITGNGSNNVCPTAKVLANLEGSTRQTTDIQALPLDTIEFDGSASTDEDGTVERYEWTVLTRPQGSTQQMLPTSPQATKTLFIDLAGHYEVELKVYDDQGAASCGEPAIVTIDATPDEDVHIQLVWTTEGDPDPTDYTGTDLDLHYLHPNGEWNSAPWDIYYFNKDEDWGVQGDASDDPSLDIDDTDSAGPENINHSGLQALTYQTGVYYYDDEGLGSSLATVRIFVRGVLELELEDQYMPAPTPSFASPNSFWKVAAIEGHGPNGPPATVSPINQLMQTAPSGF